MCFYLSRRNKQLVNSLCNVMNHKVLLHIWINDDNRFAIDSVYHSLAVKGVFDSHSNSRYDMKFLLSAIFIVKAKLDLGAFDC